MGGLSLIGKAVEVKNTVMVSMTSCGLHLGSVKVDWELSQEKTVVARRFPQMSFVHWVITQKSSRVTQDTDTASLEISLQGNRGRDARKGKGKGSLPGLEKINNRRLIGW